MPEPASPPPPPRECLGLSLDQQAGGQVAPPSGLRITRVETFVVQPWAWPLCIVKLHTSEPGLFGLGCASFKHRYLAVKAALDHHIGPFVVGRDPHQIEDIWHGGMVNGYWRHGAVLNSAIAGVDLALWDLKGKIAGLPCHQLWGGRARASVPVYVTAHGKSPEEVATNGRRLLDQGFHHLRLQLYCYEGMPLPEGRRAPDGPAGLYFDPRERLVSVPRLFAHVRSVLGDAVELLHDAHERLAPIDAVWLAKALEPHRPYFLEDPLAPEDLGWLSQLRAQSATPLAMGELFTNPAEFVPPIRHRWLDFIKVRPQRLGGITPTLKLLHLAEAYGVRFCLHGPGDNSPVGAMANLQLSTALPNHGILEWVFRPPAEYELFPGLAEAHRGYVRAGDAPGLGLGFDERLAAKFPPKDEPVADTVTRLPDGTHAWP